MEGGGFYTGSSSAVLRSLDEFEQPYYFSLQSSNMIELKKKVGGTVTTLQSASFTVAAGKWYELKLGVIGYFIKGAYQRSENSAPPMSLL